VSPAANTKAFSCRLVGPKRFRPTDTQGWQTQSGGRGPLTVVDWIRERVVRLRHPLRTCPSSVFQSVDFELTTPFNIAGLYLNLPQCITGLNPWRSQEFHRDEGVRGRPTAALEQAAATLRLLVPECLAMEPGPGHGNLGHGRLEAQAAAKGSLTV